MTRDQKDDAAKEKRDAANETAQENRDAAEDQRDAASDKRAAKREGTKAAAGVMVDMLKEQQAEAAAVPTFTLRADQQFGLHALIHIVRMARVDYPEECSELEAKLREFEGYEESHRS